MGLRLPAQVNEGATALLLSERGPDGVEDGCFEVLSGDDPDRGHVVAIAVERSARSFVDAWIDRVGDVPADLSVVDVGTGARSATPASDDGTPSRTAIRSVADVRDLGALRSAVGSLLAEPAPSDAVGLVYLDSLGAVLDAAGPSTAFELVEDLRQLARQSRSVAVICADPGGRDRRGIDAVADIVDVAFERAGGEAGDAWTVLTGTAAAAEVVDSDATLAYEDAFELLSVRRRRLALGHLVEADGPVASLDLATMIAADERSGDEPTENGAVERIHATLVHVHLPKLEAHGVVEVDDDGETVRVLGLPDRLERLLVLTANDDRRG